MIPQKQTVFKSDMGDCFRACIASILEFDSGEMPNFWEETQNSGEFHEKVNAWLLSLGYKCISITVNKETSFFLKDLLCIASGPTFRSKEEHAVIWRNVMIYDPHPSKIGILEPTVYSFLVPLEIKIEETT